MVSHSATERGAERPGLRPRRQRAGALLYAALAMLTLLPVTLPVPVLRELVQERFGVSEFLTSLFMSINMVGAALAAPVAGALADRFGRRHTMIAGALAVDALCFAALAAALPFEFFLAIRLVEGCAHIFALSLLLSVASTSVGPERRGRVMGLTGAGMMAGVATGAPLGGLLGGVDPLAPLWAGAVVAALASAGAAMGLREHGAHAGREGVGAMVRALRGQAAVAAPLLFAFADRFTVGFFTTTFSLYLRRIHDVPPVSIGIWIGVFMIPFALLSWPFGRLAERHSLLWLLCGGSLVYGLGTATLGWWPPTLLPWLMFGLGVFAAMMFVPSLLLTTELAPDALRSTALGAFNTAGSLGFIAGPISGGLIVQTLAVAEGWHAAYRAAFAVAGASELLCVAIALPVLWRRRPRP